MFSVLSPMTLLSINYTYYICFNAEHHVLYVTSITKPFDGNVSFTGEQRKGECMDQISTFIYDLDS